MLKHRLFRILSPEQKALLDKLLDLQATLHAVTEQDAFSEGYRIATRLLMDTLANPQS